MEQLVCPDVTFAYMAHAKKAVAVMISASSRIKKLVLFGSLAKNTLTPESDIDIVASLLPCSLNQRIADTDSIVDALEHFRFKVMLHFNENDFKESRQKAIHLGIYGDEKYFPKGAIDHGITLFNIDTKS